MKKILVVYYSRTGNTKKIAQMIAQELNADTDEIIDKKKRNGIIGWLIAGRDGWLGKKTEITSQKKPTDYDLIIIGSPVWSWTVTPPIRAYLKQHKNNLKKVAFFTTCGDGNNKALSEMEKESQKPIATVFVKNKEMGTKEATKKVTEFCKKIP